MNSVGRHQEASATLDAGDGWFAEVTFHLDAGSAFRSIPAYGEA